MGKEIKGRRRLPLPGLSFLTLTSRMSASGTSANQYGGCGGTPLVLCLWPHYEAFEEHPILSKFEEIITKLIESSPKEVEDYKAGKTKVLGFFVGRIMKETKGKANPEIVNRILKDKLHQA